jgi:hypothetical protein
MSDDDQRTAKQLAEIPSVMALIRWARREHYHAWSEGQGTEPPEEWRDIIGPPTAPGDNQ